MAKQIAKLKAIDLTRPMKPRLYSDGDNLYLQVTKTGTKSWVFRYTFNRKPRCMGLGPFPTVTLAKAREMAADKRRLLLDGKDPISERRRENANDKLASGAQMTFEQACLDYIELHKVGWSESYISEWHWSLKKYAFPVIGTVAIADIDTPMVVKVLRPIWASIPVSAQRLQGRLERVLSWAKAQGFRKGENPAQWRDHLKDILPKLARAKKVVHYPALPYAEIGSFLLKLRSRDHYAVAPLELLIATATRSLECLEAEWKEFDLDKKVWTIPAARMKSKREHRIPLSTQAISVLRGAQESRALGENVFPGFRHNTPLNKRTMGLHLRAMGYTDFVPHGFRSTFRDWAAERTDFSREVIEFSLAHKVGDMTEQSYFRSDLFEKRAKLMQAWADFCEQSYLAAKETATAALRSAA